MPQFGPQKLFQGSKYPEIRGFLSKKSKKFKGKKPCLGNFFLDPQSQNPTYLPALQSFVFAINVVDGRKLKMSAKKKKDSSFHVA